MQEPPLPVDNWRQQRRRVDKRLDTRSAVRGHVFQCEVTEDMPDEPEAYQDVPSICEATLRVEKGPRYRSRQDRERSRVDQCMVG